MKVNHRQRVYDSIVRDHISKYRQMVFLSGPRQVGKTTVGEQLATNYLSWDDSEVRRNVMNGQRAVVDAYKLDVATERDRIIVFDEIHKYGKWKQFLKGFYDAYSRNAHLIATGSAKMDVYKKGGDSLMGRYFPYRMHPLSVAELVDVSIPGDDIVREPKCIGEEDWNALCRFGGFPDPFCRRDERFSNRWRSLRFEQLVKNDVRDLTQVISLDQLSALAELLSNRTGEQLVYKNLGVEIGVDEKTVKKWIKTLKYLYFGFEVRPWFKNIENSIRKTPKWFVRDWSGVRDPGKRAETMVACHLLKAVEGWTDLGMGSFDLYYLRDKNKREVDFLVSRDNAPWFIVEVKLADERLSENLSIYQRQSGARHAFQVVVSAPYVQRNCFDFDTPVVVSAKTFLSQLF